MLVGRRRASAASSRRFTSSHCGFLPDRIRRNDQPPLSDGDFGEALDAGHASFWLEGEKLRGGWSLRRIRSGKKPQWLLVKRRDEAVDARRRPTSTQPESVVSGKRIEDL